MSAAGAVTGDSSTKTPDVGVGRPGRRSGARFRALLRLGDGVLASGSDPRDGSRGGRSVSRDQLVSGGAPARTRLRIRSGWRSSMLAYAMGHHDGKSEGDPGLHPAQAMDVVEFEAEVLVEAGVDSLQGRASAVAALPGQRTARRWREDAAVGLEREFTHARSLDDDEHERLVGERLRIGAPEPCLASSTSCATTSSCGLWGT